MEARVVLTMRALRAMLPDPIRPGTYADQQGRELRLVEASAGRGRVRLWFCCGCGRRCAALFEVLTGGEGMQGSRLGCRRCARVAYRSQAETEEARCRRRAFALFDRLNVDYTCAPRRERGRPAGMHRRTYACLLDRAYALDLRALLLNVGQHP